VAANASSIVILQASTAQHGSQITVLQASTAQHGSQITDLQASTAANASSIVVLGVSTAANASAIVVLQASTAQHGSQIGVLQASATNTASQITALQTGSAQNASAIGRLDNWLAINPSAPASGANVNVGASGSLAIGEEADAVDGVRGQVAIGLQTRASGSHAVAIGIGNTASTFGATGAGAVAISFQARAEGQGGIAIGPNTAAGINSIAIGQSAKNDFQQGVVIGLNVEASTNDHLVLGTRLLGASDRNVLRMKNGALQVFGGLRQVVAPSLVSSNFPASGIEGGLVFDASTLELKVFHSAAWNPVGPAGAGEANDGVNAGATGEGLFINKVGVDLRFKNLIAGDNIGFSVQSSTLTISAGAAAGETNTASNLPGAGAGIFASKSALSLQFKTIDVGTGLGLTGGVNDITIDASQLSSQVTAVETLAADNASAITVLEASALFSLTNAGGTGETLVVGASNNTGRIKSLVAGTNVILTVAASTLTISAAGGAGEINTASNLSASGEGIFASKSAVSLEFKNLHGGSGIELVSTASGITINASGNLGTLQASVTANASAITVLQASVTANASSITVVSASLTAFEAATASNFVVTNASVAANASAIVVLEASSLFSLTNAGGGDTLVVGASNNTGRIKSITAGSGMDSTVEASNLTLTPVFLNRIAGSDSNVSLQHLPWSQNPSVPDFSAQVGSGLDLLAIGTNAQAGSTTSVMTNALAIGPNVKVRASNSVAVGIFVTGSAGVELGASSSVAMGFRAYAKAPFAVAIGNEARGTGIDGVSLGRLADAAGTDSIAIGRSAIASGSASIAIGENVTTSSARTAVIGTSAGMGIVKLSTEGRLELEGCNAQFVLPTHDLDASAPTALEGAIVYHGSTQLPNFFDGAAWVPLAISAASGETNTGSNLSASGEGVFASKSAVSLEFKNLHQGTNIGLVSTASGITITASGGLSGEANTASNLSASGEGVFGSKSGVDLGFKNLHAGSGINLTSTASGITIGNTGLLSIISTDVSFEASLGAAGQYYSMNTASAVNVTVAPHASVAHPIGTQITVRNNGAGSVHFVEGSTTVTINASVLALRGQYSTATLIMTASTSGGVWDLVGDLNNT
jgi:hypothetical protein